MRFWTLQRNDTNNNGNDSSVENLEKGNSEQSEEQNQNNETSGEQATGEEQPSESNQKGNDESQTSSNASNDLEHQTSKTPQSGDDQDEQNQNSNGSDSQNTQGDDTSDSQDGQSHDIPKQPEQQSQSSGTGAEKQQNEDLTDEQNNGSPSNQNKEDIDQEGSDIQSSNDQNNSSGSQNMDEMSNNQNGSAGTGTQSNDNTSDESTQNEQTGGMDSDNFEDINNIPNQDNNQPQSDSQNTHDNSQNASNNNPLNTDYYPQPDNLDISEKDIQDMLEKLQNQQPSQTPDSTQNASNNTQDEEPEEYDDYDYPEESQAFNSKQAHTSKDNDKNGDNQNEDDVEQKESNNQSRQGDSEPQNSQDDQQQSNETESATQQKEKLEAIRDQLKQLLSQVNEQPDAQNPENQQKTVKEVRKELERSHLTGEKETPTESVEEEYDMSNANQELMNRLSELAPFESRDRGPGYAIDTNGNTEVPDSVIRTLITRFLNQKFIKRDTDLNVRSNSLERTKGFHKWDVKAVVTHLQTHQITKVLTDKYGYQYADGKNENVPLSFYFDLSGSMARYTNLLATIAIELLKKNVKVLVGFNERVQYQIDSINKNISVSELARLLTQAGAYNAGQVQSSNAKMKQINQNIDNYLLSSKAEKCVVFSDFDPLGEVVNLSHGCQVYWFCFEQNFDRWDLGKYTGFLYPVQNITDIALGLLKVSDYRFETLCFLEKENGKGRMKKL